MPTYLLEFSRRGRRVVVAPSYWPAILSQGASKRNGQNDVCGSAGSPYRAAARYVEAWS